jgi:MFS family permease
MLMYAIGTAACAFAPNMATLVFFRIVASLGIGGEWAAGAAMVAEVVPEKRRVEAGALLYTAAPLGLFLATIVTYQVQGVYCAGDPERSWRYVFLFGLLPAAVAFFVRLFVKEPERWEKAASHAAPPRISELFTHQYRAITISGLSMAVVALITWWSCNAFISVVSRCSRPSASTWIRARVSTCISRSVCRSSVYSARSPITCPSSIPRDCAERARGSAITLDV